MIMWYRFDQIVERHFLNPLNFYKIFKLGQIPQIGGYVVSFHITNVRRTEVTEPYKYKLLSK